MLCAKASPNRWPGSFLQHQLGRMWRNPPMNHTQDSRCCQFFETSKLNSTATYPLNLQKSKLQLSSQRSWAFAVQRSWFWVMGERREAGWAYHIHPFSCILQIRCNIRVYIYIYIQVDRYSCKRVYAAVITNGKHEHPPWGDCSKSGFLCPVQDQAWHRWSRYSGKPSWYLVEFATKISCVKSTFYEET